MDAKTFWHLNSHKYNTFWVANSKDDKIIFEKSDDLWRYMNDFLEQSHKHGVMQAEASDSAVVAAVGNGAAGQSGSGGICDHHHTNHIWTNGQAYTQCLLCGKRWEQM